MAEHRAGRIEILIRQCRHIAEMFDELLPETAIEARAHRRSGVNPYGKRTSSGLYLEFYYTYPSRLWTPGGQWHMTGSTVTRPNVDPRKLIDPFMARLGTTLHEHQRQDKHGCYGPVYAIHGVDGGRVEPPGTVDTSFNHLSEDEYRELKLAWAPLAEGWL
jgi:hypothetical protein